jgi:hypothetical protein
MIAEAHAPDLRIPSKTFFAIIFEGRTGSSFVVSCLNSHPKALCYPEVLQDLGARKQEKVLQLIVSGEPLEHFVPRAVQPAYFHGPVQPGPGLASVGFKTKLSDVCRLGWLGTALAEDDFRLVYLKRRNIIKAVVSELNANRLREKFGMGVSNARSEKQVLGPLHVDLGQLVAKLRRRIRREEMHEEFYRKYTRHKIRLHYEDLLGDQSRFLARLLDFLELDDQPMKGRFLKALPDRLREAIQNYQEVKHLLAGTHFEQLLDER